MKKLYVVKLPIKGDLVFEIDAESKDEALASAREMSEKDSETNYGTIEYELTDETPTIESKNDTLEWRFGRDIAVSTYRGFNIVVERVRTTCDDGTWIWSYRDGAASLYSPRTTDGLSYDSRYVAMDVVTKAIEQACDDNDVH
jgi:hypothetical protein